MPNLALEQLRAFVRVAHLGSFTEAAAALHLTQPAVSAAIRKLEDALGVPLFERVGRRKRLSPAGKTLERMAEPLLARWAELPARLADATDGRPEPVRVGAGEGPVLYLLPGPIRAFKQRHPEVPIIVRNQPVEETVAMLRSGDLDVGLRSVAPPPPDLDYRPWRTFDRVVIAPKGHPIRRAGRLTLRLLATFPLVMPWKASTTRRLVERALEREGLRYHVALEAGGWSIIKRYVALGFGVAVVPAFCIEPQDRGSLRTHSVSHLFGQDRYGLLTRRGEPARTGTRALIELLGRRP